MGVVLLSQHVEVGVATQLLAEAPQRLGYLLKDRVTDPADFAGSLRRVAGGGTALDPQVVSGLLSDPREDGPLRSLSPREREVLELVAEGRSNRAIGERLAITQAAVQKHVSTIFNKLGSPRGGERRPPHPRGARIRAARPLTRMSRGAAIALGAVIGLALGIVVSVATDVPLAPEAGLVLGALLGWLSQRRGD